MAFLPSCSGGLQSVRPDDLVSHWFDTTAPAFTYAGPRGRVIRVMHLFEEMHPPLMSLPSRSKFSLAHSASQISQPELCFRLAPRAVLLTPHGVLEIARLPGVFGPSGDPSNAATHANSTFVSLTQRQDFLPGYAASSGFLCPSTLLSALVFPTLFHIGAAHGLPLSFEGFSPSVAPGASRLAVSSVSLSFLVGLAVGDLRSASRMSASAGCVDAAPRV